jgi:alpha/beta superfamily hydrolase
MTAPLMAAVTRELVNRRLAVLRFNFRGVGDSTGEWSHGHGEVNDVDAAVTVARATHPDLPLGIAGWSFGAATSLRWIARAQSRLPWVGIAPPIGSDLTPPLPRPIELEPSPRTFILGDRDQFITVEQVEVYAAAVGGRLEVLPGSDHFFYFREHRVATLVAAGLPPMVG